MVYPIAKWFVLPPVSLWIKKVTGIKNIPRDSGFIIAANHSSYLDHLLLGNVIILKFNKKLHFLAKKEHFDNPIEAFWHRYAGAIPLDRSTDGNKSMSIASSYLKKGSIIGIYPEGTRTLNGKLLKAKTGISKLVLASKVPVVPVGIVGTFEILPKGKKVPKFKRASINFGAPIYFDKYYSKPITKKLLRTITDTVMKEVAILSKQKYSF